MKSGICPKCASDEVYSGAEIPLKKGPFASNSIPVSLAPVAARDNYVCIRCGYVESYISEADRLSEIARKWVRVKSAGGEPDAAESV
ncbi:MAG: hypothetical protein ACWGNK_05720 [Desulfobacterales bacterium]